MDETDQEMAEEQGRESNNRNKRRGELVTKYNYKRTRQTEGVQEKTSRIANDFEAHETGSIKVEELLSLEPRQANMEEFEISKLKKHCCNELKTKCYHC